MFFRLIRQPTTTLRPRSGKEYHNIDRSTLVGPHSIMLDNKISSRITRDTTNASYANITPVPEKSESPSPGYQSGSSPSQENAPTQSILPDETNHFKFQVTIISINPERIITFDIVHLANSLSHSINITEVVLTRCHESFLRKNSGIIQSRATFSQDFYLIIRSRITSNIKKRNLSTNL